TPSDTADELTSLRKLADLGVVADQNEPFGDQTWVELHAGNAWLVTLGETDLTGAAVVIIPPQNTQPVLVEMLIAPDARGNGLGNRLAQAVKELIVAEAADYVVTAWTHGDHPAARSLAAGMGLEPVRELYRMALEIDRQSFGEAAIPQ